MINKVTNNTTKIMTMMLTIKENINKMYANRKDLITIAIKKAKHL